MSHPSIGYRFSPDKRYTAITVQANRIIRNLALIALLIAAILSPTLHVPTFHRQTNYAVVSRIGHSFHPTSAAPYRLVASSYRVVSSCSILQFPAFVAESPCQAPLPGRELNHGAVSASPDLLSRFQRPPPLQI